MASTDELKLSETSLPPEHAPPPYPGVIPAPDDGPSTSDDHNSSADGGDNERATFSNKIDFLMACVGYSVGLGNFWRFPYLAYKNGGGAFLVPYFIMVILAGIPMFFLEVAMGQFMSSGGIKVWNISPIFIGIGFATTIILFLLNVYYNVIMSWAFYYLFSSFTSKVPWGNCDNDWNTPNCRADWLNKLNKTVHIFRNQTYNTNTSDWYWEDPVNEFWRRKVLDISSGIHEPGVIKWDLCLCLLAAWIIVFACISKGVKSSGKVMYVTATAPYVFMLILLIRGCTLKGAGRGILYYLEPRTDRLLDMQTWVDAGTQIFFSYSIGIGASTALGSFNKFHHNSLRDSVIFACINSGTSFLAGFVIFAVLGYMAEEQGVSIEDVAESGPGLAFVAYPKALATLPISPLWSVFFFIMVILLGLDSEFVAQEGLVATIVDIFPFLRKGYRKVLFTLFTCVLCFLVGLSMVTQGGMYVFQIFDFYSGSRIILLVAFFECVAIFWVYGGTRFMDNLQMMYGFRIPDFFKWWYIVITPVSVLVIFVMNCISYSSLTYKFSDRYTYQFPDWSIGVGWALACCSIVFVPICAIYRIIRITLNNEPINFRNIIRPKLLPHQMRPQDDPLDLNRDISFEDLYLPADVRNMYDGSLEKFKGLRTVNLVSYSPGREAVQIHENDGEKLQV